CGWVLLVRADMNNSPPELRDYLSEDPASLACDKIDPGQPILFQHNAHAPYFARLRREDPVHYCPDGLFGPYWSITKYKHIMQIEAKPEIFSSDIKYGGVSILDQFEDSTVPMFIAMDPPRHGLQRATVEPIVSRPNLAALEVEFRARAQAILDALPIGETFDWVDRVSVELTTQMLATLFDFPFEERRKLTRWSDVSVAIPGFGVVDTLEQKIEEMGECFAYFNALWNQRVNAPPAGDLISMLAHAEATR